MQIDEIDVLKHMRPKDVIVFQDAAKHFNVYIAVRRTNTASLKYIGVAGYVPKRLDCKPKTADQDGIVEGQLRELAGLVVDPTIVGEAAFRPGKYKKALKEWEKFSHTLLGPPMLEIDGQTATFAHGPVKPQQLQWPGGAGLARVSFGSETSDTLPATGPWAWFRLLNQSDVRMTALTDRFTVRFSSGGKSASFEVRVGNVLNPFTMRELSAFRCPDTF
jgi:hypothetical protein